MVERYGTKHALQNDDIKARTNLGFCNKETIDKIQKTMIERYGKQYALQVDSIREKTHQTCMNNHGGEYYMQVVDMHAKLLKSVTGFDNKTDYIRSLGFECSDEQAKDIIIGNPDKLLVSKDFISK